MAAPSHSSGRRTPPHSARRAAVRDVPAAARAASGRACRSETPRSSHGSWAPPADRQDPITLLEEQAAERVPELVPIRYGRMSLSPFSFYRGAAYVMAADLAVTPADGNAGAALRRRPPGQLRWVRIPRAAAVVRPRRLRRDASRPMGMGSEAARGKRRRCRSRKRLQHPSADRDRPTADARVPRGDAPVCHHGDARRVVRTGEHRGRSELLRSQASARQLQTVR